MMGGMGMGDVKLCAAIGAWIWWQQLVFALVIIGVAGGIMALAWATFGGFLGEMFSGAGDLCSAGESADSIRLQTSTFQTQRLERCLTLRQ